MKNVKKARQALHDNQQAWNSTMHRGKEEVRQAPEEEIVTLYTLAPASLDKPGTLDVGGYWLYSDESVPEQVLREVVVDRESSVAQLQAYRLKIPYITFSEEGLQKALVKGTVYRADNGTNGIAFDPIKAAIENAKKTEDTTMPRTKMDKLPARTAKNDALRNAGMPKPVTPQVPTTDRTPLGLAPETKAPARIAIVIKDEPETPVTRENMTPGEIYARFNETMDTANSGPRTALDAILAAPIAQPGKKHLPLPDERTEEVIVAGMAPDAWMRERLTIMQGTIDNLYAEVVSLRSQYAPEKLYAWLAQALKAAMPVAGMPQGCGEEAPTAPVPVPFDPLADSLASILEAAAACAKPQEPVKPKSTLVLGPGVGKAPKAPVQDIPGNNGKVPVDTIIAIQTAWKNKTATQAELAARYGITDKAVWYLVHRAKQLV